MTILRPTTPEEAARRTLSFLNRSCFVHHIANGVPLRNMRISPKEDLGIFHRRLERLVVSLSGAFIIDDRDWLKAVAGAVAGEMKRLSGTLDRMAEGHPESTQTEERLQTLRTIFAVLNTLFPGT